MAQGFPVAQHLGHLAAVSVDSGGNNLHQRTWQHRLGSPVQICQIAGWATFCVSAVRCKNATLLPVRIHGGDGLYSGLGLLRHLCPAALGGQPTDRLGCRPHGGRRLHHAKRDDDFLRSDLPGLSVEIQNPLGPRFLGRFGSAGGGEHHTHVLGAHRCPPVMQLPRGCRLGGSSWQKENLDARRNDRHSGSGRRNLAAADGQGQVGLEGCSNP